MPITSEPRGSKPFLPGLVKLDHYFLTNPGYTSGAHCIMHARFSDGINHSVTDLLSLATNAYNDWVTQPLVSQSSVTTLASVTASSLGGDGLEAVHGGTTVGSGGASVYPPNVAVVISWKAGIIWRGGRPRSYLPQPPQACTVDVGSPNLTQTFAGTLATQATDLISEYGSHSYSGATAALGMPSYYSRGALRPVPLFFPFISAVVHDRLATQRRRLGKESSYGVSS